MDAFPLRRQQELQTEAAREINFAIMREILVAHPKELLTWASFKQRMMANCSKN